MQQLLQSKHSSTGEHVSENNPDPTSPATVPFKSQSFVVNGINILNKNSVDSDTAMHRIIQRRKTHNRVERRRRDRMNNLFSELSRAMPPSQHNNDNFNRADLLQEAIRYMHQLQSENKRLKEAVKLPHSFEDDDLSSLSSFGSSSHCSSLVLPPLPQADQLYIPTCSPSSSFCASERMPVPPVISKRFRPQNEYESIIIFD